MTKLTDLTQPELDVLLQLAQSRTTNVVVLAGDLWRTTPDWASFDPYPLITYSLDSLSSRGLVTFRIATGPSVPYQRLFDLPFAIRLTPKGWALMGYPNKVVEVGTMDRHTSTPQHRTDMTLYRNHPFHANGGAIEVEDFPTHRRNYPRHIHMYGDQLTMANQSTQAKRRSRTAALADPTILGDPNGDGARGYVRVTPEMQATVVAARDGMGLVSYHDISVETGVPERTVKYILTDLPRLRRVKTGEGGANGSLKGRVFTAVQHLGVIKDVPELRRIVGMADTEHDIMHVLHSLHTQGRIDFDERGSEQGRTTVINIRLHKKASKVRLSPDPEVVVEIPAPEIGPEATTEETTPASTPPSAPEPAEEYPILDALLIREGKRLDGDNKAMAYVTAAEAIKDVDPEEAVRMMRKAEALDVPFPAPIEREYLRYVATHPDKETPNE